MIDTGTVIANHTISHRTDIEELLGAVNTMRTYYGLAAVKLPGTVGKWADWKPQMKALQNGIEEVRTALDKTAHTWLAVPSWPTADVINELRQHSMLL